MAKPKPSDTLSPRAIHGFVSGRVQGVGFRYRTYHKALTNGLAGWVRNLDDGRVEFLAQGQTEKLDAFASWIERGDPPARVDRLDLERVASSPGLRGFEIVE
jgi:acylphosphatase